MNLPKLYTVIWRDKNGKAKHFETNNEETAEKKTIINNGQTYIDTRYKAKLRLYWYIWRKENNK